MVTSGRAFCPNAGSAVHVANLTKSTIRSTIALCGESFADVTEAKGGGQATCARCRNLDHPFRATNVPHDPSSWAAKLPGTSGFSKARIALLARDLITADGRMTPRGLILARDCKDPTPWVDFLGIVHARASRTRGHSVCGAELLGLGEMTYDRLGRMHDLFEHVDVTCMACVTIGTARP